MSMNIYQIKDNCKIKWISNNKHIIISIRPSFWNIYDNMFMIYREKRDYSKFNSIDFYKIDWVSERYEFTLEEAIEFAKKLPDEIIEVY